MSRKCGTACCQRCSSNMPLMWHSIANAVPSRVEVEDTTVDPAPGRLGLCKSATPAGRSNRASEAPEIGRTRTSENQRPEPREYGSPAVRHIGPTGLRDDGTTAGPDRRGPVETDNASTGVR